jgi:hypothetical protein
MPTSDNFEQTLALTAPAGGAVVGTLILAATSNMVILPMTAATSGNTYTGKVVGLVKSVIKKSNAAWVVGDSLRFTGTKFARTTINTQVSQATAAAAATSGAIVGDVILRFPCAGNI